MNIATINNVLIEKNMQQKELSKLTGINPADICRMLNYNKSASEENLKKMYMALHIDFKREDGGKPYPPVFAKNQISLRNKNTATGKNTLCKKKITLSDYSATDKIPVDYGKIKELCRENGLTLSDLSLLIGKGKYYLKDIRGKYDCKTTFDVIKAMSKKLKVSIEDIIADNTSIEDRETDTVDKTPNNGNDVHKPIPVKTELKHIDTQDVFENFKIINENLIAYAEKKDKEVSMLTKVVDNCQIMITNLTMQVSKMEDILSSFIKDNNKPAAVTVNPKIDIDAIAERTKNNCKDISYYVKAYSKDDSFDEYAKKINAMVTHIKNNTGKIHNQIFHELYNKLNTVYGANLDGMKKEFTRKYGRKPISTVEEIYDNEIFRNIFYNLVIDEVKSKSKVS